MGTRNYDSSPVLALFLINHGHQMFYFLDQHSSYLKGFVLVLVTFSGDGANFFSWWTRMHRLV